MEMDSIMHCTSHEEQHKKVIENLKEMPENALFAYLNGNITEDEFKAIMSDFVFRIKCCTTFLMENWQNFTKEQQDNILIKAKRFLDKL